MEPDSEFDRVYSAGYGKGRNDGIITGICIGVTTMLFGIFMRKTVDEVRDEVKSRTK